MSPLRETLHRRAADLCVDLGREHRLLSIIRGRASSRLAGSLGNTVRHGPFAGFELPNGATWGASDHSLKVLGLYEQSVQTLVASCGPFARLFCLGAADGFYGVGMVRAGLAGRSLNWEMAPRSRATIEETARINGVEGRVAVFGAAGSGFDIECGEAPPGAGDLVLIDVEGAEYDILTSGTLARLCQATFLIELHPFLVEEGEAREAHMLDAASEHFEIRFFDDCVRDLGGIDELADLSDDMRWLLCSEARAVQMRWAVLRPKK